MRRLRSLLKGTLIVFSTLLFSQCTKIKGTDIGGEFESQGYIDQMPEGFLSKKQFRPLK